MSEVAIARSYILGFLSGLKFTKSDKFFSYQEKWISIDMIDDDNVRHEETIQYYKTILFVNGGMF